MRYFIDTEFIEGFKKPIPWLPTIGKFNKPYHSIQLISIGIVAEDGRSYYAISNEYRYKDASEWVKMNVILPMYLHNVHGDKRNHMTVDTFHKYIPNGKSNKQIAKEIIDFVNPRVSFKAAKEGIICFSHMEDPSYWIEEHSGIPNDSSYEPKHRLFTEPPKWIAQPTFYGYYSDYDWVVFCSLFGTMMDLPKGFPMYCIDLKQTLDEKAEKYSNARHVSKDQILKELKSSSSYPKQSNEHNALDDAKWNLALFNFLNKIK